MANDHDFTMLPRVNLLIESLGQKNDIHDHKWNHCQGEISKRFHWRIYIYNKTIRFFHAII